MMGFLALGIVFVCFVFTFWGLKLLHTTWWRPKMLEKKLRKLGNIHVLPYKPPFGNIKEMKIMANKASSSNSIKLSHDIASLVDPFLHQLVTTYKKSVVVWYAMKPNVIVMDPKLIREILTMKYEFRKLEFASTMKFFLKGLASSNGDTWALHRKIINPAFHIEKLKGMLPTFMGCCEEMIEKWEKLIGSKDSIEVDVMSEFQDLTGDVISRAAFGSNLQEGKLIFSHQRKLGAFFLESLQHLVSPWSRFLLRKLTKKMMHINQEVKNTIEGLIKKREKAIISGDANQNDLLTHLLKSNTDEIENKKSTGMSRDDVIEECKLFYFAGYETTANLLTWTMIVLSFHQNWQDMARNEILQLIGKNKPNFNDLNQLKIVHMILLEVLRLYPPALLVRGIHEDTEVGEYIFPSGVMFTIPTYLIHRDPEVWGEDANEFNPDRFSNGIAKATKDQSCFLAFGWGPRICIGQNFAMLEAKLALVLILQNFSFHLSSSYRHSPKIDLILQPQFGAQIILSKI